MLFRSLKAATEALDNAVNDVIMSSLIRIGENSHLKAGGLLKAFGLDSTRKKADTTRSELSIKSVPYDTISREAITNAIPGYLRKILVAVGGKDEVYDYRSRSFKSLNKIKKEFREVTSTSNAIRYSSEGIRRKINTGDPTINLAFDLMMDNLSSITGDNGSSMYGKHELQSRLSDFSDPEKTYKYIKKLFPKKSLDESRKKQLHEFAKQLSTFNGFDISDLKLQAARQSINRNKEVEKYLSGMDDFQMNTSILKDKKNSDRNYLLKKSKYSQATPNISSKQYAGSLNGLNYTNAALFEIYRRLNKGINVYQTGQISVRTKPYENWGENYLKRPEGYRPKTVSTKNQTATQRTQVLYSQYDGYENPLTNNETSDGDVENLSKGDRFKRWGKTRGGEFMRAMSAGNPDEIRKVISDMTHDVSNVAGKELKKGMNKINNTFGNASGYLKNKLFGLDYKYTDDNGKTVHVKSKAGSNGEKGGFIGFLKDELKQGYNKATESAKRWIKDVQKDFDYGDDDEDKGIKSKRKKLIGGAIGAFAGAGILGGPMGLLAGSLAGSALSTSSIGKKLKDKLFGIDKETGKSTGLLTKLFDKVTRPVEYQVKKTLNFFAQGIKKHILGPISDIGFAFKNRIKKKASSFIKKHITDPIKNGAKKLFGMIFKGIGWGASKLWEGITGVKGSTTRGKAAAGDRKSVV